ncbi:MAG: TetR/AcrR family transcriptional regulator [Actinomycetota bacterium]
MLEAAGAEATSDTSESEGRRRILDEAARLFVDQGYAATTLRQIATAAGIKAGSVYYHYASKDELFDAVLARGIDVMEAAFADAAEGSVGHDGRTTLRHHVRAHLASLFEHGPYTAAHVTAFHTAPPEVRTAAIERRDAYESLWTELLHDLMAEGDLRPDLHVTTTRLILFGAMNSTVEWFDPDGRRNLDELAEAITEQFWSGAAT